MENIVCSKGMFKSTNAIYNPETSVNTYEYEYLRLRKGTGGNRRQERAGSLRGPMFKSYDQMFNGFMLA